MAAVVRPIASPGQVLADAGAFLESDPVRHNLILTLLHGRVTCPEPGRYWITYVEDEVVGVAFQSPLDFIATTTPMPPVAVSAVVETILAGGVQLPGVSAEAATAARFAGHWAEQTKSPAHPVDALRIYELIQLVMPCFVRGVLRQATRADQDLLVAWVSAFKAETGELVTAPSQLVERRLAAGQLWIWDDGEPAAMAGISGTQAGVVRVGPVYTPPARRNCGYASALVAALSHAADARGERCILYTQLANPTSNSIYRSIGYRAVAEVLRYRFDASARGQVGARVGSRLRSVLRPGDGRWPTS